MKQINIFELQNSINQKENLRISVFQKILEKCHQKIKTAAVNEQYFVLFDVPQYIVGLPLYNLNKCIEYLINQLKENGFTVEHKVPKLLVVSWFPKNSGTVNNRIEHQKNKPLYTDNSIDKNQLFLNYIPYKNEKGKFVLNVD